MRMTVEEAMDETRPIRRLTVREFMGEDYKENQDVSAPARTENKGVKNPKSRKGKRS